MLQWQCRWGMALEPAQAGFAAERSEALQARF